MVVKLTSMFYPIVVPLRHCLATQRHNKILKLILNCLKLHASTDCYIFADLTVDETRPISSLFHTLRPNVAIICKDTIEILELTVCHGTNFTHSKIFKVNKDKDRLKDCLNDKYKHFKLLIHTFEISPIGIFNKFSLLSIDIVRSDSFINNLITSAISSSFGVYCDRNKM